jgi:hypothetical protein
MITLHITETEKTVTVPKKEFFKLVERYKKIEPVQIIEEESDDLTEEEIKIRAEAMEELARGETINFQRMKDKWLKGESAGV